VGLNLTAANHVYVMEPQYNPGVEQQAVDRVHRIGQRRETHIYRLVMADSIEGTVLELQARKRKLAALTLERGAAPGEGLAARLEEVRSLFR
jgi:SNF2 family DNA or RNA helicase